MEPPDAGEVAPPPVHPERHVFVWVDSRSGMPAEAFLDGCATWDLVGVGCDLTEDPDAADVHIFADDSECDPDGDGSYTLAYAYCCGPIVFYSDCFLFSDGTWDKQGIATVAAHEIGHQFGLWWHVPESCMGAPDHPTDGPVCGDAVMNPYYDPSTPEPNTVDTLAFDIRDTSLSVVDDHNHHEESHTPGGAPSCVYTVRP